jgi:outer membrane protein assembly factor BamD
VAEGFYIFVNDASAAFLIKEIISCTKSLTLHSLMRIFLCVLSLALVVSSCSKFSKVQKSNDYDYKLRMAERYYINKDYNKAQILYEELFPIYRGSDKFEDIFYKFAYCSYNLRDWLQAENLFKQFTEVFPNSPRAEEMQYMRAYTFVRQSPKPALDQTNTNKAIGLLQAFINTNPNSSRVEEAKEIIENLRKKLETKEYNSALLYYNLGHYQSAAIAFSSLMEHFPDSEKSDVYKLEVIKSYYLYAENSIESKKIERFQKVIQECNDFLDRFVDSELKPKVENYASLSQNNIKALQNEQVTPSN